MPGYKRTNLSALNRLRKLENTRHTHHSKPKRRPLSTLVSLQSVLSAMEEIEKEIQSLLRQTSCTSYSEAMIDRLMHRIQVLKRDYTSHKTKASSLQAKQASSNPTPIQLSSPSQCLQQTINSLQCETAMSVLPLLADSNRTISNMTSIVPYSISDEDIFLLLILSVVVCGAFWLWWSCHSQKSQPVPNDNLQGYHVVITGGSSGIGLSLAELFYHSGAMVTLAARNMVRLKEAQTQLMHIGGGSDVHVLSIDLCDSYTILKTQFDAHIAKTAPVDILVHCAGYAVARTFLDTPAEELDRLMHTNYLSAVNLTKALLRHMIVDETRSSKDRRIAFLCSMGAQVGVYGMAAYCGSKYALRGFAEVLRLELEASGPLVTVVYPPDTDTPGLLLENIGKPAATHEISSAGGLVSSDEVARVIFHDIIVGKMNSSFGFEGKALSWATAGVLPPLSMGSFTNNRGFVGTIKLTLGVLAEVAAASPLRAVGIGYSWWMRRIVRKHADTA